MEELVDTDEEAVDSAKEVAVDEDLMFVEEEQVEDLDVDIQMPDLLRELMEGL